MQRKNILKFVSLLGVSSFVMLAAASCTQAITPVPKSGITTSEPNTTNPNSSNNDRSMQGKMSEVNTNPSGDQGMVDVSAQQLASAKKSLMDLLDTETNKVALYSDYAGIQMTLESAYQTAKNASQNANPTVEELKSVQATLQTAIDKAASDKQAFDNAHLPLVTAYNNLKTTLLSKTKTLEGLTENKYKGIEDYVTNLFNIGSGITTKKLDSFSDPMPDVAAITKANDDLTEALTKLPDWKQNADKFDNFEGNPLSKTKLFTETSTTTQEQPANWSFAGYSVDLTTGASSTNLQNLNFAQRKVWMSNAGNTSLVSSPVTSNDVSWIYSLGGMGTKYTITFDYYGPNTAHLYFPYKLVKTADSGNLALQYKLNDGSVKAVHFKMTAQANSPAASGQSRAANDEATEATAGSDGTNGENSNANPAMPEVATMIETPTVDNINVAKIPLTNLNFGQNTIEFSLPTEPTNKVAPLIGNMYITSNPDSQTKIYDQIFGNTATTSDNRTSVTVDLLKGYGLASGWSTYVYEFNYSTNTAGTAADQQTSATSYLIGFIGGPGQRALVNRSTRTDGPTTQTSQRTLTIYVNAPKEGEYYISGSYLTSTNRNLKLSVDNTTNTTNSVSVSATGKGNWNTLGEFNTQMEGSIVTSTMKRTLTLKQGLNKVLLSDVSNADTPYVGNLTFTLNTTTPTSAESSSAGAEVQS
ncbi:FIVAR domain-containing protein [Mycoplasma tullyi]|uniref:FIVAR domain-containing protein n=1 Tax=Mycoplasma tullyi TaxID=1612150 RepID=A0A7D7U521_9MOLU|nr:FIVAR domain-containing protein [Mycoplasma tullyi]QMT98268.1 FIVAR domain-containing protein [Mycoplasma tullyi]